MTRECSFCFAHSHRRWFQITKCVILISNMNYQLVLLIILIKWYYVILMCLWVIVSGKKETRTEQLYKSGNNQVSKLADNEVSWKSNKYFSPNNLIFFKKCFISTAFLCLVCTIKGGFVWLKKLLANNLLLVYGLAVWFSTLLKNATLHAWWTSSLCLRGWNNVVHVSYLENLVNMIW